MKAIRLRDRKGKPENLFYEESPAPFLETDDALIRVHACAITKSELTWTEVHRASDGKMREFVIPGHEVSGVIENIDGDETGLKIGDEIYALVDFSRQGAAAELVAIRARDAALKPKTLNFTEAAAVPLAGLTAWQALFDHAELSKGQKILIHGAAGGVGSFAVQFAHWAGAYVICTAQEKDEDFLHELGADEVIDYEKTEFEEIVENADVVFDTVGGETLDKSWRVLRHGGTLVTVHTAAPGENPVAKADKWGVRGVYFIVKPNRSQLAEIACLIDEKQVEPIIDRVYSLADARAAFERLENNDDHKRGKIILQVN